MPVEECNAPKNDLWRCQKCIQNVKISPVTIRWDSVENSYEICSTGKRYQQAH